MNSAGHSSVTNSAIHDGYGWAITIKTSGNIHFAGNVMYNFRTIGMSV